MHRASRRAAAYVPCAPRSALPLRYAASRLLRRVSPAAPHSRAASVPWRAPPSRTVRRGLCAALPRCRGWSFPCRTEVCVPCASRSPRILRRSQRRVAHVPPAPHGMLRTSRAALRPASRLRAATGRLLAVIRQPVYAPRFPPRRGLRPVRSALCCVLALCRLAPLAPRFPPRRTPAPPLSRGVRRFPALCAAPSAPHSPGGAAGRFPAVFRQLAYAPQKVVVAPHKIRYDGIFISSRIALRRRY